MGKQQKKQAFYAVRSGRKPGVYTSWNECKMNINGFGGAVYKKFDTQAEAEQFANVSSASSKHSKPNNNTLIQRDQEPIRQSRLTSDSSNLRYTPYQRRSSDVQHSKKASCSSTLKHGASIGPVLSSTSHSSKKTIVVYTDGASSNNGKNHARAGYGVYWGDNDPRNASVRLVGKQTNQRAEASAVIHALEQTQHIIDTLEIMTDSQYVINAATSWSKNWIKNNWKSSSGSEIQNKDLFQRMLKLIDERNGEVKFTYVPGHQGVEGNEKADQLAVAGAQKIL